MLKFPCICGKNFALENDQAGSEFQCPACGRLVIAPTLNELESFGSDGTYKVGLPPAVPEPGRAAELRRAFARKRTDETGNEIDLRTTMAEWMQVGDDPSGLPAPAPALKYDPETGELVQPIDIKPDEPSIAEPVAAIPLSKPTLSYARVRNKEKGVITPPRIFLELLMPQNIAVILFIVLFHLLMIGAIVTTLMGFVLAFPVAVVCFLSVTGQYALVLEEVSLEGRDEIPRPMRWFNFADDIWRPFLVTGMAVLYSYWPAALAGILLPDPKHTVIRVTLFLLGSIVFPAALITTTTGDMIANLRPDRVLRVMSIAATPYWAAAGAMLTGMVIYLAGLTACGIATSHLFGGPSAPVPLFLRSYLLGLPTLFIGVYILHFSAWYLGLIWREHHHDFPWVGQQHARLTPEQRRATLDDARAEAKRHREMRETARREGRRI